MYPSTLNYLTEQYILKIIINLYYDGIDSYYIKRNNIVFREEQIAATAGDILLKTPITSMDVGTYDLLQTKAKLLMKNGTDVITPCQIVILQELER